MTPEDRKRKYSLQWRACLYTDEIREEGDLEPRERCIVPMDWLIRALEGGGKSLGTGRNSKGPAVMRSVTRTENQMILRYDGPQDILELADDPRFRWKTMVNSNPSSSGKSLVPSCRPRFPQWEVTTDLSVVTSMGLSWDDFQRACHAAGNIGIGDARELGYGRFRARITKLR